MLPPDLAPIARIAFRIGFMLDGPSPTTGSDRDVEARGLGDW